MLFCTDTWESVGGVEEESKHPVTQVHVALSTVNDHGLDFHWKEHTHPRQGRSRLPILTPVIFSRRRVCKTALHALSLQHVVISSGLQEKVSFYRIFGCAGVTEAGDPSAILLWVGDGGSKSPNYRRLCLNIGF